MSYRHSNRVSVVNFHPAWGDKAMNIQKMKDYIELAAALGVSAHDDDNGR